MCSDNGIPRIIHYCWFGGSSLPLLAVKCIDSWKRVLPDFELREWNEENFDLACNQYVQQANESRKWAFVTDFVRLKVLYDFGGIYMDTDVEVIKPLDEFMKLPAFSGFEGEAYINTGIIGAKKGNKWIKELIKDYDDRVFIKEDGSYDQTTNVKIITNTTKNMYPINLDNTLQAFDDVSFYPLDWFCAKSYETGEIVRTENTHTIHHFSGSWLPWSHRLKSSLTRAIGNEGMRKMSHVKQFLLRGIRK
ncbi:glycosyltransferase [Desulfitobacterium sp. THU1]|uniref:glycosyltransferase family 32 protein n=1 Tax=Desulfitobacterium sp. THU1 TaxID=3138072 RepID=UPI00311F66B4